MRYMWFLLVVVPAALVGAAVLLPMGWGYHLIKRFVAHPFIRWLEWELGRV